MTGSFSESRVDNRGRGMRQALTCQARQDPKPDTERGRLSPIRPRALANPDGSPENRCGSLDNNPRRWSAGMNPARLWVTVQLDLDSTPVGSGLNL